MEADKGFNEWGYNARDVDRAFGATIREYRTKRGWTQEALAEDCTADRTYISMLERGRRSPSLRTIHSLAQRFGVTMADMLARVESLLPKPSTEVRVAYEPTQRLDMQEILAIAKMQAEFEEQMKQAVIAGDVNLVFRLAAKYCNVDNATPKMGV